MSLIQIKISVSWSLSFNDHMTDDVVFLRGPRWRSVEDQTPPTYPWGLRKHFASEGWMLGPWLLAWIILLTSFRFRIGSIGHMLRNWKMAKLKNKWPLKYWRAFTLEKNVIPFPGTFTSFMMWGYHKACQ